MAAKRAFFTSSLDEAAKESLTKDWIVEHCLDTNSKERSENEKNLSMCMYDPDLGFEMILRISESTENKLCLLRLGTWHLEEWLAIHGEKVIVRVEDMATHNLTVKRLLSCVYQNSMSANVYARAKAAAINDGYFND